MENLFFPSNLVAGVDEAGRGPLAGAVFAAAVILNPADKIAGLNDSKKLSEKRREILAAEIKNRAAAWAIARASVAEIDQLNILNATFLAMRRAIEALKIAPEMAVIDGNRVPPDLKIPAEFLIQGDAKHAAIAAASILAKTARDATMRAADKLFPQYEFAKHKGYGTARHLALLQQFGACELHRRTFAPVKKVLNDFPRST